MRSCEIRENIAPTFTCTQISELKGIQKLPTYYRETIIDKFELKKKKRIQIKHIYHIEGLMNETTVL